MFRVLPLGVMIELLGKLLSGVICACTGRLPKKPARGASDKPKGLAASERIILLFICLKLLMFVAIHAQIERLDQKSKNGLLNNANCYL
jgi:hypothetical protein